MEKPKEFGKVYKKDISDAYAEKYGTRKADAEDMLENMLGLVVGELLDGNSVMLANFFNFKLRERKEKRCKNPRTLEDMIIPKTVTVVASMTKPVKDKLQGKV